MAGGVGGGGDILKISGWSRKVSAHGVVYYAKRGTNETRWVHPGLSQLLSTLCKYDNIRYAAYRLSSKLLTVQAALGTHSIPLALAQSVLAHHGLSNQPNVVLDSQDLREFLADLFIRSTRARGQFINSHGFRVQPEHHEANTEALASFIEQILDPSHDGSGVTVLGLKTVLAVLTGARLRDRLAILFRDHSDHQARLTEPGLRLLLVLLTRVPELLGEGIMFGGAETVQRGVTSCLARGGGRMVTEEVWMSWASREPPELVWLTTSYRQQASAKVQHPVKCSSCSSSPIMGLRYQCLQCLSYDLCQHCFFIGASSRGHKPVHPVQEYCYPSTRREEAKAFFSTIVNKIRHKKQVSGTSRTRRKVKRTLTADRVSAPTPPPTRPSWSQLLQIRVSPRTSQAGSDQDREKASPVSSGFCSGEDSSEPPSKETSPGAGSEDNVYEKLHEIDSPNLEWDEEVGINLGDSRTGLEEEDREILQQLENFENSIFRKDQETGDLLCYQHNTRGQGASLGDQKGKDKVVRRTKSRHENKHQMASIIGHLEDDHRRLERQLSTASPALVQPVLEAQGQLNRLKDLMNNIFASNSLLDQTDREEDRRLTENSVCDKVAESTRLEGRRPVVTPRVKLPREGLVDNFSPIPTYSQVDRKKVSETVVERVEKRDSDQSDYLQLVKVEGEDEEEDATPVITFNCITDAPKEETPTASPRTSASSHDSDDLSMTQYTLGDLSRRLGGTGLYISRDNGLDITERLGGDKLEDSRYGETVDELEKLMARLSDVFESFRKPPAEVKLPDDKEEMFGIISGINDNLCKVLADSRESDI